MREAPPSPPPGPARDALARAAADRAERAEHALTGPTEEYARRVAGVVLARLRSPKTRKGTRHWAPDSKTAPADVETKALDADYVVPDTLIRESVDILRPGVEQVARDAATDAAERIVGGTSAPGGMFEVDDDLLADLIDEALEDLLGSAERYAADLRQAVLDGDADGMELDDLVETVEGAAERGGKHLRLNARTVATALAGEAQIEQAKALGVTHLQWISRRDDRVRSEHVIADGQIRPVNEPFDVGGFKLRFPGDPTDLPASGPMIFGCRCGLLFADADDDLFAALTEIAASALADLSDEPPPGVDPLLDASDAATLGTVAALGDPAEGAAPVVPAPENVTGWRLLDTPLDVAPGQHISLPAGTELGLVAPDELTAETLAVLVPAGTAVRVAAGTLVLAAAAEVQVLAAGAAGIQSRIAP